MCKLNVYLFPSNVAINDIEKDMLELGIKDYEQIKNDFKKNQFVDDCIFFISPTYRCHCGSGVASFQKSYYSVYTLEEMIQKEQDEKNNKKQEIKEFMARECYEEEKKKFLEKQNELKEKANYNNDWKTELINFNKNNKLMLESTLFVEIKAINPPEQDISKVIKTELEDIKRNLHYFTSKHGEIKYVSYWQGNEIPVIKQVTEINLYKLSVELLATLDEGELLIIKM